MHRTARVLIAFAVAVSLRADAVACRDLTLPPPVLSYERSPDAVFRDLVATLETRRPGSVDAVATTDGFLHCLEALRGREDAPEWLGALERDAAGLRVAGRTLPLDRPDSRLARRASELTRGIVRALGRAGFERDRDEAAATLWHAWVEALLATGHRFDDYVYANELDVERGERRGRVFMVGFRPRREGDAWIVGQVLDDRLAAAGFDTGVRLVALDGRSPDETPWRDWVRFWYGASPFAYRVTYLAEGRGAVTLDAEAIPRRIETVDHARFGRIGYVRIHRFARETRIELRRALRALADTDALVLDLRSNAGGYLDVGLIDIFFRPGHEITAYLPYRPAATAEDDVAPEVTKGTVEYEPRPLTVLIDRKSASMSELLAAAVRQHERGTIVGETSFGKGVSQTVIDVGQDGQLHLVENLYFYPGTRETWHEVGIVPHYAVDLPQAERERLAEALDAAALDLPRQLEFDAALAKAVELSGGFEP